MPAELCGFAKTQSLYTDKFFSNMIKEQMPKIKESKKMPLHSIILIILL